jgi:FkbM family methyltransferase
MKLSIFSTSGLSKQMNTLNKVIKRLNAMRIYYGPTSVVLAFYSWIMRFFPGVAFPFRNRLCKVRLRDLDQAIFIRLGTSDADVIEEIFGAKEYQPVIPAVLEEPRVILDLGSNIGASIRFWHRHFPNAQIIAVEPDAGNMKMCRLNSELGGYSNKVFYVQACVASHARDVILEHGKGAWGITMHESDGNQNLGTVPAMSVPDILMRAGVTTEIDLLKCDIEGAEQEVFSNCGDWLPLVRRLVIELHAPYLRESFLADVEHSGSLFDVKNLSLGKSMQVLYLQRSA